MFLAAVAHLAVEVTHLHPRALAHPAGGNLRKELVRYVIYHVKKDSFFTQELRNKNTYAV